MGEIWIKNIREFQQLDKNGDMKLTADEVPPESDVISACDSDKDQQVSVLEWMQNAAPDYQTREKTWIVSRIFGDGLFKESLPLFEQIGVNDKYDILIYLLEAAPGDKSNLIEQLTEQLPLFSALTSLGFSQEDALRYVAPMLKFRATGEDLKSYYTMLEKAGFGSRDAQDTVVRETLSSHAYTQIRNADKLNKLFDLLNCNQDERMQLFEYENERRVLPSTLDPFLDEKTFTAVLSVLSVDELKQIIFAGIKNKDLLLDSLVTEQTGDAIEALRKYGADDQQIKMILFEFIPKMKFGPRAIVDSVPKVLEAFAQLRSNRFADPVKHLLMTLNSVDKDERSFNAFLSLPAEVAWLKNTFKDPNTVYNVVSKSFHAPFDLSAFHLYYNEFVKSGVKDVAYQDVARFTKESESFSGKDIVEALETFRSLKGFSMKYKNGIIQMFLNGELKVGNLFNVGQAINFLRSEAGLKDEDILGILIVSINSEIVPPVHVFTEAVSVLKALGIGTTAPKEMVPYLKGIINQGMGGLALLGLYSKTSQPTTLLNREIIKRLLKEFPIENGRPSEFWDFLFFVSNSDALSKPPEELEYYLDLCKRVKQEFGITRYGRFSAATVEKMLLGERKEKHAFVVTSRTDWNGAFYDAGAEVDLLISQGYSVHLIETESERDIYRELEKYPEGSIDLLYLCGHGQPKSVSLNSELRSEEGSIDYSDTEWSTYLTRMKKGGQVIFASCSTGKGLESMIYRFKEWAGSGRELEFLAPPEDCSSKLLGTDGKISIEYICDSKKIDPVKTKSQ